MLIYCIPWVCVFINFLFCFCIQFSFFISKSGKRITIFTVVATNLILNRFDFVDMQLYPSGETSYRIKIKRNKNFCYGFTRLWRKAFCPLCPRYSMCWKKKHLTSRRDAQNVFCRACQLYSIKTSNYHCSRHCFDKQKVTTIKFEFLITFFFESVTTVMDILRNN